MYAMMIDPSYLEQVCVASEARAYDVSVDRRDDQDLPDA